MVARRIVSVAVLENEAVAYLWGEWAHQSQHNDFSFIFTCNGPVSSSASWIAFSDGTLKCNRPNTVYADVVARLKSYIEAWSPQTTSFALKCKHTNTHLSCLGSGVRQHGRQ